MATPRPSCRSDCTLSGDLQQILMCVMQPVVSWQRPLLLRNCCYASSALHRADPLSSHPSRCCGDVFFACSPRSHLTFLEGEVASAAEAATSCREDFDGAASAEAAAQQAATGAEEVQAQLEAALRTAKRSHRQVGLTFEALLCVHGCNGSHNGGSALLAAVLEAPNWPPDAAHEQLHAGSLGGCSLDHMYGRTNHW